MFVQGNFHSFIRKRVSTTYIINNTQLLRREAAELQTLVPQGPALFEFFLWPSDCATTLPGFRHGPPFWHFLPTYGRYWINVESLTVFGRYLSIAWLKGTKLNTPLVIICCITALQRIDICGWLKHRYMTYQCNWRPLYFGSSPFFRLILLKLLIAMLCPVE